jgi:hypothetical protein
MWVFQWDKCHLAALNTCIYSSVYRTLMVAAQNFGLSENKEDDGNLMPVVMLNANCNVLSLVMKGHGL